MRLVENSKNKMRFNKSSIVLVWAREVELEAWIIEFLIISEEHLFQTMLQTLVKEIQLINKRIH